MTEREVSSERLPEYCPHCDRNWIYHHPAIVAGTDKVRCIECKTVFDFPVSSERVSEERLREIIAGCEGVQSNLMPFIKQLSGLSTLSDRYLQRLDPATVKAMAELALLALRSSVKTVGVDVADTCDGVEQKAFEAWASAAGHDMHEHPMHYLFLDPKTDAARQGWKAGITHARQRVLSAIEAPAAPSEVTPEQVLDAAYAYLSEQYGSTHLGHPSDRRRILDSLNTALKGDRP